MKKLLLILSAAMLLSLTGTAQTAVNFTVPTCAGVSYDLYAELNAGKVVVIGWTMPCGSCVLPLKTTYNVVQSYQSSHPGMVEMLIVDDYANTPCASIDLWANSNGMTNTRRFSNNAIKMMDYGSTGMPKVVVVGGPDKQVYYNANNAVDHVALQAAINQAISIITSNREQKSDELLVQLYPNPTHGQTTIELNIKTSGQYHFYIYDNSGKVQMQITESYVSTGRFTKHLPTEQLKPGVYLLQIVSEQGTASQKISILK
jgi:hypothetical protein